MCKLVSIIIPVYNGEKTIARTLDSVCNQTYKNIEILAIDDGSKDMSLKVLNEYAERDSRIKVFSQENGGPGEARNLGLSRMTGDYVTFVDSDDVIGESIIEKLISQAEKNDPDVIRYNFYYSVDGNSKEQRGSLCGLENCIFNKEKIREKIIPVFIKNELCSYSVLLFMKKEVAENIVFDVNTKYMEDTLFYIDLLYKIESIYFLDEADYYYFYTPQKAQEDKKFLLNYINSLNYVYKKLGDIVKENEGESSERIDLLNLKWLNTIIDYLTIIARVDQNLKFEEWKDIIQGLEFGKKINFKLLNITVYNKVSIFLLVYDLKGILYYFTKFRNFLKKLILGKEKI